ncbi:MAG TPA: thiamine phosphate synthase [Gaiellaceae bacterium]|nr:thiamine phosphate synthase [Gaiellaceae bacterium]
MLRGRRLYFVTGIDGPLEAALAGGVDVVQLRDKDASDVEIVEAGRRFRRLTRGAGALLVVNDRPDLAAACDADGVHVGQDDMTVAEARAIVGPARLVGLSTHSPEQIREAAGADYLGVGPVFATPTKPGRPPVGLELVREAARAAQVPWFAIGGVDLDTVAEVVAAGATRIAVVRAIADAADPRAAAAALRSQLGSDPASTS